MNKKSARTMSLLVFLIAFASTGEICGEFIETHFVRATKYHRTDHKVDHWTARGYTSTQLRLPKDDRVVTNPNIIGNVAVDPLLVPEGSLVYETQTERFFVSTTGGTAVIDARSSRAIARMRGLCQKYYSAPVFDFYNPRREIVDNHFTECLVIPHDAGDSPNENGRNFRFLNRESQNLRLTPGFWIKRLEEIRVQILRSKKEERREVDVMLKRLKEMHTYQKSLT